MATIVASASGGTRAWSDTSTWVGGVVPTAADSVQIPLSAGNVTIDTGAVCRGLDCATYTGTLTHNAAATLTIGDGTAALSNIALRLASGMNYSLGSVTTSAISFISTSATVQTVDFVSKTSGDVTYNAASGGSWQMTGTHNVGTTTTVTLTKGTLDVNAQTCSWGLFNTSNANTRALTLGAAAITLTGTGTVWNIGTATSLTLSAASSTITCNGATAGFFGGASKVYGTVNMTGSGAATVGATAPSFGTLNRTGTAIKTDSLIITGSKVVTGTLILAGNSITNRLLVTSNTVGTPVVVTNSGATMTWSNVDFMDIDLGTAFDASAITGGSGDAGGNSDITFTAAVAQTWSGTSGGVWSTNAWTSRVPLPQDDVTIASAFTASQTVTADMPRLGRSITWVGATGTPTWGFTSTANNMHGSLTLIAGMALTGTQLLRFRGRSSFTITSAGQTFAASANFVAPGGTYTLQDAFTLNSASVLNFSNGTLDANGFNVTAGSLAGSNTNTRTLTLGVGTWTLTATSSIILWDLSITTGLTFSGASATIVIGAASVSTRTFAGGGLTYGTLTYTVAGSTGTLAITGSNTLGTYNFSDASNARTMSLTAGTTQTFTTAFNVNGTAGKLMSIVSATPGSAATLSKASGAVTANYLSLQDSAATGGATWTAVNSVNVSGNTGWLFAYALVGAASGGSAAAGVASAVLDRFGLASGGSAAAGVASAVLDRFGLASGGSAAAGVASAVLDRFGLVSVGGVESGAASAVVGYLGLVNTGGTEAGIASAVFDRLGLVSVGGAESGVASAIFDQLGLVSIGSAPAGGLVPAVLLDGVVHVAAPLAAGEAVSALAFVASGFVSTGSQVTGEISSVSVSPAGLVLGAAAPDGRATPVYLVQGISSGGVYGLGVLSLAALLDGSVYGGSATGAVVLGTQVAVVSGGVLGGTQVQGELAAVYFLADGSVAVGAQAVGEYGSVTASSAGIVLTGVFTQSAVGIVTDRGGIAQLGLVGQGLVVALCPPGGLLPPDPVCLIPVENAFFFGPSIRHLYASRVGIYRLTTTITDGAATLSWQKISTMADPALGVLGEMKCRLDLMFVRPGKDQPMPIVAGRAPDRVGIMFFDSTNELKAGDQIRCLSGPVIGTFELRAVPDVAVGFSYGHHSEVQVIEVAQNLDTEPSRMFPAREPYEVP